MRIGYADPPYLGYCRYYDHFHPDGRCWDDLETHELLVKRLSSDFDAWAMSLSMPSLRDIWPLTPSDTRVLTWCKSFASYKPGVHPAYATEPILIRGPRTRRRDETTVADFHVAKITLQRGLTGAKPESVIWWVLAALNAKHDDEFTDLFTGSGAVGRAWDSWRSQLSFFDASVVRTVVSEEVA